MKKLCIVALFLTLCYVGILIIKSQRAPKKYTSYIGEPSISSGPGKYWHSDTNDLMPNPLLSPGEIRTTDSVVICEQHTSEVRKTTSAMKKQVYAEYDVEPHVGICTDVIRKTKAGTLVKESCEVDHIIPLELGGADTVNNLWPQPYNPDSGLGAHAKDRVEDFLHQEVCTKQLGVVEAQREMVVEWEQIYRILEATK